MNTDTCFCCYLLLYVVICCYLLQFGAIWCCLLLFTVLICCYLLLIVAIHCPYLLLFVIICCYFQIMRCIMVYTNGGNVSLTLVRIHVLHCFSHAIRQCQANELLLWERPHECFVLGFARFEAMPCQGTASVRLPRCMLCIVSCMHWGNIGSAFAGSHRCMFCIALCKHWGNTRLTNCFFAGSPRCVFRIVFYTHLGNMRLTNCLCGIAQMHVWYCVVHILKQYQADGWLLWELPGVCFVTCFAWFEAMSGQWNTTSNNWQSIKFCTHYGNIRISSCFCGIV